MILPGRAAGPYPVRVRPNGATNSRVTEGPKRRLLPHEHGAYGQILLPLLAGLAIGRPGFSAALLALAALSGFLAYEPLLVAAGHRGQRAKEQDGTRALRAAALLLSAAVALGAAGFLAAPLVARWAALAPPLLAGVVALFVWSDAERTAVGEVVVATALSSAGYPVALASGASLRSAAAAWVAWVLAFGCAALAVQAVLGRARKASPDPGIRSAAGIVAFLAVAVGTAVRTAVPWAVPAAVAPVALSALGVVLFRVSARHLKAVGWTILSAATVSLAVLVAGLR